MKQLLKQLARKVFAGSKNSKAPQKNHLDVLVENGLTVGHDFNMLPECIIDFSHCWHISIGNYVTLAPRVIILAHDASTKMHLDYTRIKNVSIGNYVFVGAGSIIMPGVTIGDNVIIGAGSVVTKDIPEGCIYAGNPCRLVGNTREYLIEQKSKMQANNTFGKEYQLEENLSDLMKNEMKKSIQDNGIAFVF